MMPRGAAGSWLPQPWLTALPAASLALLAGTLLAVYARGLPGTRHRLGALACSGREISRAK